MKTLLITLSALVLFLGILAASIEAQQAHCFDKSFQTQLRVFEPKRDFIDTQMLFVDADAGLTRTDMIMREPVARNVSVYINYKLNKRWIYEVAQNFCHSDVVTQPQQPFCISSNATYVRSDVIGGTLKVDVYDEKLFGFSARILYAPATNTPVEVMTKAGGFGNGMIIEEYFNWIHQKPAPAVFTLPQACKNVAAQRAAVSPQNKVMITEVTKRVDSLLYRKSVKTLLSQQ
ncbi:hypothetical protein FDP41_009903 [Naegleria fowleri]|uniref:Methanolan biosynthesis EpsI domain-containing protein n=1 Tax=Naegleria fowleri TaxID=5763 RepID=A0A6A5BC66_NAEFO|nr:uncharacterized protein FDP41_009903 [Naegleria fowleri]KAF0971680.1 hypothetical protein FDP41_009903 [Naegleria fowleri]